MRTAFLLLVGMLPAISVAQEGAPAPFPAERYAGMKAKTPFVLATPKVAQEDTPSFAKNLFVSGLAKLGDDVLVTITAQDNKQSFTLKTGETTSDGIAIVSVDWSDELGKSRVTVKKGNDFGTIGFNEMLIRSPIAMTSAAGMPQPGTPQPPSVTGGPQIRRPNAGPPPSGTAVQTRRRPIIRRPSR